MPCSSYGRFAAVLRRCCVPLFTFALCTSSLERAANAQEPPAEPTALPADTAPPLETTPPAPAVPAEPAAPVAAVPADAPPADVPAAEPPPAPKPPPYSLPWQLRPAAAASVVRLDTAFAFYEDPVSHKSGSAIVPILNFSYKVMKGLAPIIRLGVVSN